MARILHWPLVDKDDSRDCFEAVEELRGLPPSVLNNLAYEVMFRIAAKQLRVGNSVILDCPMARVMLFEKAQTLAKQVGFVHHVLAPADTCLH